MDRIKILISGIPGKVGVNLAGHFLADGRFTLLPVALTGPGVPEEPVNVAGAAIDIVGPERHREALANLKESEGGFIVIDYSHPSAVNANAALYCDLGINFVMGTTGGDRAELARTVESSSASAVIAPNMAKPIVGFTAMMEYMAENFPGIFSGWDLSIRESHQAGKADTSGTARAMVGYFNRMGMDFSADRIFSERDPERQRKDWGIPEEHLKGHGWHTYDLTSPDKTVALSFTHNISGRDVYYPGTADAAIFLSRRVAEGNRGKVYSMLDVMRQAQ